MISLKTVFNYIKFANELTNKVSFMFNGIKKYVVRIVCVIMLLLVQFDVCAPLIDANLAMVETMEQPTLPSDNNEESGGEETYYFMSGRAQLPNSRFLPCTIDMIINLFAIPQVPVQSYTPVSENLGKSGTSSHYLLCIPHLICHIKVSSYILVLYSEKSECKPNLFIYSNSIINLFKLYS